jgi:hypothetical protein
MSKDLVPPELRSDATPQLRAIAGTIVGHPWQPRFYFQLDAFLAAVTIGKVWNSLSLCSARCHQSWSVSNSGRMGG